MCKKKNCLQDSLQCKQRYVKRCIISNGARWRRRRPRQGPRWVLNQVKLTRFLLRAFSGSSMKTDTRRMSVSSTERWCTATPSSPWWPSLKPWPASRSTTATRQDWWASQTRTSPHRRAVTLRNILVIPPDAVWSWDSNGVDSKPHVQTSPPQTSICSLLDVGADRLEAAAAWISAAAAPQTSSYASHSSRQKPLSL